MTFFHDSATDWADDHSLSAETRFGRLETTAFQRHPEIFRPPGAARRDGGDARQNGGGVSGGGPAAPGWSGMVKVTRGGGASSR